MIVHALIAVGALVAGLFLFWVRQKARSIYGLCEIAAGVFIVVFTFFPIDASVSGTDQSQIAVILNQRLAELAGLYVIVRGLDNLGQGGLGPFQEFWNRLFG